jgi:hypothetical protein
MSRSVSNVNISTDSFLAWITQTNKLLEALRTDVITVSTSITGGNATLANTTGNAQLIGIFGANTVVATDGLRGGNATATNVLNILSNTSVTGDFLKVGANVQLNATSVSVGNSTINLVATQNLLKISNATSTANLSPLDLTIGSAVVNATVLTIGTGNFSTGVNVGANVNFTTSSIQVVNSISNVVVNSGLVKASNSTSTANLTPSDLTIGSAIVNSTILTIGIGNFSTGANIGANVNFTTSSIQVVNSISNVVVNSGLVKASNSTSTANLTPKELTIGATVVNSSLVTVTGVNTSYANVTGQVNTATLYVATSANVGTAFTANASLVNAIALNVVNQTNTATLYVTTSANIGTAFTANASLVNAIALNVVNQTNTTTLFATTSANVGGNVQMTVSQYGITGSATVPTMSLTTSALTIGNSTITGAPSINLANSIGNTTVNAIAIGSSWGLSSNSTGLYHSGVVNSFSHTSGSGFIANSTAIVGTGYANVTTSVNSALLTVGTNFIANATALVHTGFANVTTSVNSASHTVGTNFIANATALVHTGFANVTTSVNTALFTVGTTFTANATLVNAAAINVVNQINTASLFASSNVSTVNVLATLVTSNVSAGYANVTGQVNTTTLYAGTSANVGGNVQITVSQYGITGNATTVPTMSLTASSLTIGNSSITGAPQINIANNLGNTIVNTTSVSTTTVYANTTGIHTGNVSSTVINASANVNAPLVFANVSGTYANITGQVNTTTFFATTSANVGANVQLTTSQLFIGNSTANVLSNSTIVTIANSTGIANLQPALLTIGGSVVNTTYVAANNLVINTDCEMRVSSNTLNANITSAQVFFTFATSFSSAKITAQVKRSGNVQTSDMIIVHDGTDAFISVYGTVIAPSTSSDLGDFSVGVNAGNVELKYQQTAASSVIKVIAHLIK